MRETRRDLEHTVCHGSSAAVVTGEAEAITARAYCSKATIYEVRVVMDATKVSG
jgi:hypothetical protein